MAAAIKALGITRKRFASCVKLGQPHISSMCNGNKVIKDYHLLLFEKVHKVNSDFIRYGTAPMLLSAADPTFDSTAVAEPSSRYGTGSAKQIEYLERIIKEKERLLNEKERYIKSLEAQLQEQKKD